MSVFELKLVLFHFWGKSAGGFVRRVNIPLSGMKKSAWSPARPGHSVQLIDH